MKRLYCSRSDLWLSRLLLIPVSLEHGTIENADLPVLYLDAPFLDQIDEAATQSWPGHPQNMGKIVLRNADLFAAIGKGQ